MSVFSEDIRDAQFENENSLRLYPFSEISRMSDCSGDTLPQGYVVDLHMAVPLDGDGGSLQKAYMTSFHVSRGMVSACFQSGKSAMSVTVSSSSFRPYFPYRLESLVGSEDAGGIVTFGEIDFDVSAKTYFMKDSDGIPTAEVHPCCVIARRPAGLRKIVDPRSGESVSGDVSITFSGYVDAAGSDGSVKLSLQDGAAYTLSSECLKSSMSDPCGATPISSINGVSPDSDGNIVLWFH